MRITAWTQTTRSLYEQPKIKTFWECWWCQVYCVPDYCALVAPRCSGCGEIIQPLEDTGILVRIQVTSVYVHLKHFSLIICISTYFEAMNQTFHVDCFSCSVCGCQLSDDPGERWPHPNISCWSLTCVSDVILSRVKLSAASVMSANSTLWWQLGKRQSHSKSRSNLWHHASCKSELVYMTNSKKSK